MDKLIKLRDDLWEYSELGFKEFKSSKAIIDFFEDKGFKVNKNLKGMETAFEAIYGNGKPVITFLAEYDALDGLSQAADVFEHTPLQETTCGHGCGHHLLAIGSIHAFLDLKEKMEKDNLKGTIKLVGCPAEEAGSAKAYLARDGYFDDVDIALTWHPGLFNVVNRGSSQACIQAYFRFHGISSHAASAPHLGRSALDGVELMSVGVNYLREHMGGEDRVHYAITNSGGNAPNVVQSFAEVRYFIRSSTGKKVKELYERVCDVAKGAALMSGTEVEIIFDEGLVNLVPNQVLENLLDESFERLQVPVYTSKEREYAKKFKETYNVENIINNLNEFEIDRKTLINNIRESELCDYYIKTYHSDVCSMGSTDVGDVSWVVPTGQIRVNCFGYGADAHSWQWVAQGKSSIALKGALKAGEVLSDVALKLIENPSIIDDAKKELHEKLGNDTYECLIPKDVKPHVY